MDEFENVSNDAKSLLSSADKPSMSSTPLETISFGKDKQDNGLKAFTKNLEVQMSPELIK